MNTQGYGSKPNMGFAEAPACVQNAMMTKDKKPFTYTPGGIDLNEIKSERMAKRLARNALNDFSNSKNSSQGDAKSENENKGNGTSSIPPPPPMQNTKIPPPPPPKNLPPKGTVSKNFDPPPLGFRPKIVIPPNPMANLKKITPPVEKNTFWKDELVKNRTDTDQNDTSTTYNSQEHEGKSDLAPQANYDIQKSFPSSNNQQNYNKPLEINNSEQTYNQPYVKSVNYCVNEKPQNNQQNLIKPLEMSKPEQTYNQPNVKSVNYFVNENPQRPEFLNSGANSTKQAGNNYNGNNASKPERSQISNPDNTRDFGSMPARVTSPPNAVPWRRQANNLTKETNNMANSQFTVPTNATEPSSPQQNYQPVNYDNNAGRSHNFGTINKPVGAINKAVGTINKAIENSERQNRQYVEQPRFQEYIPRNYENSPNMRNEMPSPQLHQQNYAPDRSQQYESSWGPHVFNGPGYGHPMNKGETTQNYMGHTNYPPNFIPSNSGNTNRTSPAIRTPNQFVDQGHNIIPTRVYGSEPNSSPIVTAIGHPFMPGIIRNQQFSDTNNNSNKTRIIPITLEGGQVIRPKLNKPTFQKIERINLYSLQGEIQDSHLSPIDNFEFYFRLPVDLISDADLSDNSYKSHTGQNSNPIIIDIPANNEKSLVCHRCGSRETPTNFSSETLNDIDNGTNIRISTRSQRNSMSRSLLNQIEEDGRFFNSQGEHSLEIQLKLSSDYNGERERICDPIRIQLIVKSPDFSKHPYDNYMYDEKDDLNNLRQNDTFNLNGSNQNLPISKQDDIDVTNQVNTLNINADEEIDQKNDFMLNGNCVKTFNENTNNSFNDTLESSSDIWSETKESEEEPNIEKYEDTNDQLATKPKNDNNFFATINDMRINTQNILRRSKIFWGSNNEIIEDAKSAENDMDTNTSSSPTPSFCSTKDIYESNALSTENETSIVVSDQERAPNDNISNLTSSHYNQIESNLVGCNNPINNISVKNLQSDSEFEDSGITDLNKQISESEVEIEQLPKTQRTFKYNRTKTHSRLFDLLQSDESSVDDRDSKLNGQCGFKYARRFKQRNSFFNDQESSVAENPTPKKREFLPLPLRNHLSIDADNPSTPNSPSPSMTDVPLDAFM